MTSTVETNHQEGTVQAVETATDAFEARFANFPKELRARIEDRSREKIISHYAAYNELMREDQEDERDERDRTYHR